MPNLTFSSVIPASPDDVFTYHTRPGALQRLIPPFESASILDPGSGVTNDSRVVLRVRKGPLVSRWTALHSNVQRPLGFTDEQLSGPMKHWRHDHRFQPGPDPHSCRLTDHISFSLPLAPLSNPALPFIRDDFSRAFAFRHRRTAQDIAFARTLALLAPSPLRILVSGSSGLLGREVSALLRVCGHTVLPLIRSATPGPHPPDAVPWNPADPDSGLDPAALLGIDAVLHLAGRTVAGSRWTPDAMRDILRSRVDSTRTLARAIARCSNPPRTLVCASAVGIYAHRADEPLDESSPPGNPDDSFLARVCLDWEAAADEARAAGVRCVHARLGVALTPAGGALPTMLTPFRLGLGGRIGTGSQFFPWITIDDAADALARCLADPALRGPVLLCSPTPVRSIEFTRTLSSVLRRPQLFPVPAAAIKLALGRMGEEILLSGQRCTPRALMNLADAPSETNAPPRPPHSFRFPELRPALEHLLGVPRLPNHSLP